MSELLVFRLFGPLASWGEIAVGQVRPSAVRPTRSALLGLLAGGVVGVVAYRLVGVTLLFAAAAILAGLALPALRR